MRERLTRGTLDMDQVARIIYGLNKKNPDSGFLDAENQQEVSEANALPRGRQPGVDYTTLSNFREIRN